MQTNARNRLDGNASDDKYQMFVDAAKRAQRRGDLDDAARLMGQANDIKSDEVVTDGGVTVEDDQTDLWTYGHEADDRVDTCPHGRSWCDGADSDPHCCLGCFEVSDQ